VIACLADRAALDALVPPGLGATTLRVAPDEILVVAPPEVADRVQREITDRVRALDRDALVLDVSDGWAALALRGDDARDAFAYLSPLPPPDPGGWIQGDVARVAAKVLGDPDGGLTILVPAYWGDHLRERIVSDARATDGDAP
jgi:hypothetical protein